MIDLLEDIIIKENNEDKRIAYGYCVYLSKIHLEGEKDAIIDAYFEGAKGWFEEYWGDVTDYDKEEAKKYYNDTFTK